MYLQTYVKKYNKTQLIFDFDRTLFQLLIPWEKWLDDIKNKLLYFDAGIIEDYKKKKISLSELENRYVEKYPQTKELMINNALSFEKTFLKGEKPNNELLSFIRTNLAYTLYIWSSNTPPTIDSILSTYNLRMYFQTIITRLDVRLIKPDSEGFTKIYNPSIPKQEYLFVGDSKDDAQAAKSAGIDFFHIKYFNKK